MKVLVAGATGGCGRLIVRRLTDLGISTRVFTRDARRAGALGDVEVVEGNALSADDCRRAVEGCHAVICALGERWVPRDHRIVDGDGVINLAEAACRAGARRFILVSGSIIWAPFFIRWFFHALRVMPIAEEKVRSEAFIRSSELAWTILWPGFLSNSRVRAEPLLLPESGRAPGLTSKQAVADVAVRCLNSENAIGQVFIVVDRSVRWGIWRGKPVHLDVPWTEW